MIMIKAIKNLTPNPSFKKLVLDEKLNSEQKLRAIEKFENHQKALQELEDFLGCDIYAQDLTTKIYSNNKTSKLHSISYKLRDKETHEPVYFQKDIQPYKDTVGYDKTIPYVMFARAYMHSCPARFPFYKYFAYTTIPHAGIQNASQKRDFALSNHKKITELNELISDKYYYYRKYE